MTQASGSAQASDGQRAYGRMDDAIRFLRELRQLRSEAGLEAAELAARSHYPHEVIVAAEAGPGLPELPVLSAYVRGCGGGLAEWEERWRSVTGSPATSLHLPARPAGCSSLAEAGAQAAYNSPPVDPEDQRRILAAITRAAAETEAMIPARPSPARSPSGWATAARELATPGAAVPAAATPAAAAPGAAAAPAVASAAGSQPAPVAAAGAGPASVPAAPSAARATRRRIAARRAALPYGAGIAAIVAAIMCIVGAILLLIR